MERRLALITSGQKRHRWIASRFANAANLVLVISERKPAKHPARTDHPQKEIADYFKERKEREEYWFADAPEKISEITNTVYQLSWGEANNPRIIDLLVEKSVDTIFLFGSSIIRNPIISQFQGRIINMHLGLSPYYRGSATNFWPLVDGIPECVGVTIHHATLQVDGGNILLQARPDIYINDSSHDIGCKSIISGWGLIKKILKNIDEIPIGATQVHGGKLCRRDDFNLKALQKMKLNFKEGMIESYLRSKDERNNGYPLVECI